MNSTPVRCIISSHAVDRALARIFSSLDDTSRQFLFDEIDESIQVNWPKRKLIKDFRSNHVLLIPWVNREAVLVVKERDRDSDTGLPVVLTILHSYTVVESFKDHKFKLLHDFGQDVEKKPTIKLGVWYKTIDIPNERYKVMTLEKFEAWKKNFESSGGVVLQADYLRS